MDVLDMVYPGILLQNIDQQQILRSNFFESKCSSKCSTVVSMYTPRVMAKTVSTSAPNAEPKESLKCHGSSQQPYDSNDPHRPPRDVSGANDASNLSPDPGNIDKPIKKIKKKKKKKGRNNLTLSDQVVAGPGTSQCHQDTVTTSSQPSKDEIGNAKDNNTGENPFSGYVSQSKSHENDNFKSQNFEGWNGGNDISSTNKSSSRCTSFSNAHAVAPSEHNNMILQTDMVKKPRCDYNIQTRKENGHSIGQKSRRNFKDVPTHWVKRSNVQKDINFQEQNFLVKHSSFSSDELLPSHMVLSAGSSVASRGVDEVVRNHQGVSRTNSNAMSESFRWIPQRFHAGLNVAQSGQDDIAANTEWRKSEETLSQALKHKNTNCRTQGAVVYKANTFHLRNRMFPPKKEGLDVTGKVHLYNKSDFAPRSVNHKQRTVSNHSDSLRSYPTSAHAQLSAPQTTISGVSDRAILRRVHSYNSVKIPMVKQVLEDTSSTSIDNGHREPAHLHINLSVVDNNVRQDSTSQASIQRWVPLGKKNTRMLNDTESVCSSNDLKVMPNSCGEQPKVLLDESVTPVCESVAPVNPGKTSLISCRNKPSTSTIKRERLQLDNISKNIEENYKESVRGCVPPGSKAKGAFLLHIGSQSAVEALNAAYRLQIASESIQLATGSPLAEFERLLHSATPVIAPAFVLKECDICLGIQRPHGSLCKHQIPKIPLTSVWNWYEKPGNYGLEVKAQDIRKLKGFDIDPVSFNAHFVPFLSAVQLFVSSLRSTVQRDSEIRDNGEWEKKPSSKILKVVSCPGDAIEPDCPKEKETIAPMLLESGESVSCSDIFLGEGNNSMGLSSIPTCSSDMELIFEFFEHDQPQTRKPFYDKVMELVRAGTSNNQVFGNPCKLESMNLDDLHPASWYSVAWYPIYRIPEGNFRASFLTYHSLGHLVQRSSIDAHEENQFCVVSPVLGLQSYNAQAECWFYPNNPDESSQGFMSINCSEILKERLRTLEETASLFGRGCIYKDHIKVTNRQPDYEFFLSRKH